MHAPRTRLHAHTYARTRCALRVASRASHVFRVARVQVFVDVVGLNEALDASDGESDISESGRSDEEADPYPYPLPFQCPQYCWVLPPVPLDPKRKYDSPVTA